MKPDTDHQKGVILLLAAFYGAEKEGFSAFHSILTAVVSFIAMFYIAENSIETFAWVLIGLFFGSLSMKVYLMDGFLKPESLLKFIGSGTAGSAEDGQKLVSKSFKFLTRDWVQMFIIRTLGYGESLALFNAGMVDASAVLLTFYIGQDLFQEFSKHKIKKLEKEYEGWQG